MLNIKGAALKFRPNSFRVVLLCWYSRTCHGLAGSLKPQTPHSSMLWGEVQGGYSMDWSVLTKESMGKSVQDHFLVQWEWKTWCAPFTCFPAKLRTPWFPFLSLLMHFILSLLYPKCTRNIGSGIGHQTSFYSLPPSCLHTSILLLVNYIILFLCFGKAAMSVTGYILFPRITNFLCLKGMRTTDSELLSLQL